ncbi:MAG: hypothetical protein Kow009_06900 [Spirochaetales bacterium]
MEKSKIVLWGGIGAFLFSALLGMVGEVDFLTLMLRALLGAGGFALVLGSSLWVIERFLPELLHQPVEGNVEQGNRVDLVIPEHNPHLDEGMDGTPSPSDGPREFEDFVEEIEEVSQPVPASVIDTAVDVSLNPSEPEGGRSKSTEETVDDLPDLGGFAETFEGSLSSEVFSEDSLSAKGTNGEFDGGDPAVLAKAIQTMLKKDKEG